MQILLIILAAAVSAGTIIYGVKAMKNGKKGNVRKAVITTISAFGLIMLGAVISTIFGGNAFAETAAQTAETAKASMGLGEGLKYLSAALCTAIATLATAKAVSSVAVTLNESRPSGTWCKGFVKRPGATTSCWHAGGFCRA